MRRLQITSCNLTVVVVLRNTETGSALFAATPFESRANTWGGGLFAIPVDAQWKVIARGGRARTNCNLVQVSSIVIGFDPKPIPEGGEIRPLALTKIWAGTEDDVRGSCQFPMAMR